MGYPLFTGSKGCTIFYIPPLISVVYGGYTYNFIEKNKVAVLELDTKSQCHQAKFDAKFDFD